MRARRKATELQVGVSRVATAGGGNGTEGPWQSSPLGPTIPSGGNHHMLHKLRTRAQDEKGFTLIELLVVILIIGILAAIALPAFLNQRSKAQDTEAKSAARTAQTALETYYTDEQNYNTNVAGLVAIEPALNEASPLHGLALTPGADVLHGHGHAGQDRFDVHDREVRDRRRHPHLRPPTARRAAPPAAPGKSDRAHRSLLRSGPSGARFVVKTPSTSRRVRSAPIPRTCSRSAPPPPRPASPASTSIPATSRPPRSPSTARCRSSAAPSPPFAPASSGTARSRMSLRSRRR